MKRSDVRPMQQRARFRTLSSEALALIKGGGDKPAQMLTFDDGPSLYR